MRRTLSEGNSQQVKFQGWDSQGACSVFAFHFNTDGRGRGNLIPCLSKIIIVKVEYSSRKRSGLGATMVHQLKVERSKPCGQFFLLPRRFLNFL